MIRILKYGQVSEDEIFARAVSQVDVSATVREIIQVVRTQGDQALFDYTARFDGAALGTLQVSPAELDAAIAAVEPEFLRVLEIGRASCRERV